MKTMGTYYMLIDYVEANATRVIYLVFCFNADLRSHKIALVSIESLGH